MMDYGQANITVFTLSDSCWLDCDKFVPKLENQDISLNGRVYRLFICENLDLCVHLSKKISGENEMFKLGVKR